MSSWAVVYSLALLVVLTLGLRRWKVAGNADRLLIVLLIIATLHEGSSLLLILNKRTNMPNFHVYSPLELLITCWYFRESATLPSLKKTATIASVTGVAASVANTFWLQPIQTVNSNFLLYEATTIIILCLLSCYDVAIREEVSPFATAKFWVTVCLLIYWSLCFATYGMLGTQDHMQPLVYIAVETVLLSGNLLFYAGLALIFIYYKRLRPSGE